MKTDLAIDLASHQTLKELRIEAREILEEVNEIISSSDPKETPECVQWRNSRCLAVGFVLADTSKMVDTPSWSAVLSRPAGPFEQMADYIYARLSQRRGSAIVLSCYE
jgi:hypothetical protein